MVDGKLFRTTDKPYNYTGRAPNSPYDPHADSTSQKKEQAAADSAAGGQKKKKVTAAQLRVQKGKRPSHPYLQAEQLLTNNPILQISQNYR